MSSPPTEGTISMVSYAQLVNMDTSKLTTAAETSGSLSGALTTNAADVQTAAEIPSGIWAGPDSGAASDLLASLPSPLYDASDMFTKGQRVLETLATEIETAKEQLQDAHSLVAGTGITIGLDGAVTTPVVESVTIAEHNDELARQARAIIDGAVQLADKADALAEKALSLFGLGDLNLQDVNGDAPLWMEVLAERVPNPIRWLPPEMQSKVIGTLAKETAEAQGADCKEINGLMTCVNVSPWMYERGGTTIGDTFLSSADSFEELESRPAPHTLEELINHEKYHRDEQWRRYGLKFASMYGAEEAVAPGSQNRYERAAEEAGKTGY